MNSSHSTSMDRSTESPRSYAELKKGKVGWLRRLRDRSLYQREKELAAKRPHANDPLPRTAGERETLSVF